VAACLSRNRSAPEDAAAPSASDQAWIPKSTAENSSSAMKAAMATVLPQLPIIEAHIDVSLHFLIRSAYIVMLRVVWQFDVSFVAVIKNHNLIQCFFYRQDDTASAVGAL
jgi:hypothetical protein